MEFKAIVDAKARHPTGCAVVGVYENGELGVAARQIDKQLDGMIANLHASGDFAAKLGDSLLLPLPSGSAASRLLLIGLGTRSGFARKQYRKALQAAASALAKTGAGDAVVYLASGTRGRARYAIPCACHRGSILLAGVQDSGSENRRQAEAPNRWQPSMWRQPMRARAKAAAEGLRIGAAVGSGSALARDLANLPPNVCTPTYLGSRALQLAKDFSSIKTKVLDESGIKALKMGAFLAVTQGSEQPPRLIVCEYRGGRKGAAPICLGRKGHYVRFRRNFSQGPPRHGRNEIRHERRRDRSRHAARGRRAQIAAQRGGDRRCSGEHAERQRREARRHRHHHVRTNGRDSQHRRRGPAGPVRLPSPTAAATSRRP